MTLKNKDKEILIQHRIRQSDEAIETANFLLENKQLSLAVNRLYYSIFYIVSAVAIKSDYSTSKHKQLLGWFNKNFIGTGILEKRFGKLIYNTFEKREKSDYDFVFELSKEDVTKSFTLVKEFISSVKELLLK